MPSFNEWRKTVSVNFFLRLYLSVVKMLLTGTNILLIYFLCLFYFLKQYKLCHVWWNEPRGFLYLHDVTFLALCHLFCTLSLCNPFRFFSCPLCYFWWGIPKYWLLVGWLAGLVRVLFEFSQEAQNQTAEFCLYCLMTGDPWLLGALLRDGDCVSLLLQEVQTIMSGTTTCVAQIILFFSSFMLQVHE